MDRRLGSFLLAACLLAGASEASAQRDTVSLLFLGDVMCHGPQCTAQLRPGGDRNDSDAYDFSSFFSHVRDRIEGADLAVANLEFPCGVIPYSGFPFFSAPKSLAEEAVRCGVDVFLTANNHICDKGRSGMDSTYRIYSQMGVPFTGFYRSEGEEYENNPLIINVKGIDIALINFTYGTNGIPVPAPYRVNRLDTVHVREVVSRARSRGAEFIVALPHWGEEYQLDCNAEQRRWTEFLYDQGVDAVVGSHPHVVQKAEFDPPHATAYSLGNFVSNQSDPNTQIGLIYELLLVRSDEGVRIVDAIPTYTWCSRRRMLEAGYTVIPILEWLDTRDQWMDKTEYDKMDREWRDYKRKFNL